MQLEFSQEVDFIELLDQAYCCETLLNELMDLGFWLGIAPYWIHMLRTDNKALELICVSRMVTCGWLDWLVHALVHRHLLRHLNRIIKL